MSDPQNFGLGELGQRLQAMSDPAPEPRLRPYQGGSPSGNPATVSSNGSNGLNSSSGLNGSSARPIPSWEDEKPPASPYSSYSSSYAPAPAAPYTPPAVSAPSSNGYPHPQEAASAATASSTTGYAAAPPATPRPTSPQAALPAPEDANAPKSGLQRAVEAVRSAIPLVQRLLPLLDGNFATAIGGLMTSQPGHHPPPPAPVQHVHVDLEPVERGLAEVRTSHRELRNQVVEHSTALKRVEDHLERVREATDRNTLEQQELVEDLRAVGSRVSTLAIIGLVLLTISVGVNIFFLVQLQHILR
jgi:hypothetical protein